MMILIIGRKSANRAFTLLEMIIVLAVMTMFFAVSIPLFTKFTENAKLEMSTRSVVSALRTARGYAITNNQPYYVFFDTGTNPNSYYITATDAAVTANAVEKVYKLPIGISFGTIGFSPGTGIIKRAAFKTTGELDETAPGTSVSLTEQTSTNTKTITVERTTGRARID